jgi:signal transduction histidine kinase
MRTVEVGADAPVHEPRGSELAASVARIGGLAALLWAVSQQLRTTPQHRNAGIVLTALAAAAWLAWLASRRYHAPVALTWTSLAVLAASGGALAAYAPIAICFLAVAALGAAIALGTRGAVAVSVIGVGALTVATGVLGSRDRGELVLEGVFAAAAGLFAGAGRRQYLERATQAEELLATRLRADAERDRAAALAERNRLGRELHDVLAHSLGALAVQLEAADAVLEDGDRDRAQHLVRQARGLASDGLAEARRAVQALRGEPGQLAERLSTLATQAHATLVVAGRPVREPDDDAQLALYRAAQEAVSNARKHAPGAEVTMALGYSESSIELVVTNRLTQTATARPDLARSGGGFGLRGMRERLEQVGGSCVAGPVAGGWEVRVAVPL